MLKQIVDIIDKLTRERNYKYDELRFSFKKESIELMISLDDHHCLEILNGKMSPKELTFSIDIALYKLNYNVRSNN